MTDQTVDPKNEILALLLTEFNDHKLPIVRHEEVYKGLMDLKIDQSLEYKALLKKRKEESENLTKTGKTI